MNFKPRSRSGRLCADCAALVLLGLFIGGCGLLVAAGAGAGAGYVAAEENDGDGEGALGDE